MSAIKIVMAAKRKRAKDDMERETRLQIFQQEEQRLFADLKRARALSLEEARVAAAATLIRTTVGTALGIEFNLFFDYFINASVPWCRRCMHAKLCSKEPLDERTFCPHLCCGDWWVLTKLKLIFGNRVFAQLLATPSGRRLRLCISRTRGKCASCRHAIHVKFTGKRDYGHRRICWCTNTSGADERERAREICEVLGLNWQERIMEVRCFYCVVQRLPSQ